MTEPESKNRDENGCFAKGNDAGGKTQFKPGQAGNPNGSPKSKTHLWRYVCQYLDMTDAKFAKAKAKKLTQAQQAAIKIVEDFVSGTPICNVKFAKYATDRDLGKAIETIQMSEAEPMSDEDCDAIREMLKQNCEQ